MGEAEGNWTSPEEGGDDLEDVIQEFIRVQYSRYKEARHLIVLISYFPLVLTSAAANSLVIYAVLKYRYMRSVTNYFLVNLSVADLLVTIVCMPAAMGQSITGLWILGDTMCKLTSYFQGVAVGASVFTLMAMSIDRYLAIKHSMAFRRVFNSRATLLVVVGLWVVPLLIFGPLLWVRRTDLVDLGQTTGDDRFREAVAKHQLTWCIEDWGNTTTHLHTKHVYGVVCFVVVYLGPGLVVLAAYSLMGRRLWSAVGPPSDRDDSRNSATIQQVRVVRERRRVARLLLVLATIFALCWLPYNILSLVLDLDVQLPQDEVMAVYPFALLLGHANSALNPLLYCWMTRNIRRTVLATLSCSRPGSRARSRSNNQSNRTRKHSCRICCRFVQPRKNGANGLTSSSGYESCGQGHLQLQGRCLVLTTLNKRHHLTTAQPAPIAASPNFL